jgi:hypothetical protein
MFIKVLLIFALPLVLGAQLKGDVNELATDVVYEPDNVAVDSLLSVETDVDIYDDVDSDGEEVDIFSEVPERNIFMPSFCQFSSKTLLLASLVTTIVVISIVMSLVLAIPRLRDDTPLDVPNDEKSQFSWMKGKPFRIAGICLSAVFASLAGVMLWSIFATGEMRPQKLVIGAIVVLLNLVIFVFFIYIQQYRSAVMCLMAAVCGGIVGYNAMIIYQQSNFPASEQSPSAKGVFLGFLTIILLWIIFVCVFP